MNSLSFLERLETALTPWMAPRDGSEPKSNGAAAAASPKRMRRYAETALENERKALAASPKGGRNYQLFVAGCKLGRFVDNGVLSSEDVESALVDDACGANGLLKEDGARACRASLASGLRKAEGDELPELEDRATSGDAKTSSVETSSAETAGANTAGEQKKKRDGDPKITQAQILCDITTGDDVKLFHSSESTAFADLMIDGHRETWPVKSAGFRRWLRLAYYKRLGGVPNSDAMSSAMGLIEAKAQFERPTIEVYLRVAEYDSKTIYLDLCDHDWCAVKITDKGWEVVTEPLVRFRRTAGMLPIPIPVDGGNLNELRTHLHMSENSYVLAVSWLLAILRGKGPFPILAVTGEHGTGKSFTADLLRRLVDPRKASLRSLPRDTRDLYVAAMNAYVLVFDNLSGIPAEISDALCKLASGAGFSTRAL
jgi:hypothetical protein